MIHKKETDSFIFNRYISIGNPGLEHNPERVLEPLDFDPKNPTAPKSLFFFLFFYCWLHMVGFHRMQSMGGLWIEIQRPPDGEETGES